jgi:hypothetical protein
MVPCCKLPLRMPLDRTHKNRSAKGKQLDDGIGDTLVLGVEALSYAGWYSNDMGFTYQSRRHGLERREKC